MSLIKLQVPGYAACCTERSHAYKVVQSCTFPQPHMPTHAARNVGVKPLKLRFLLVSTTRINPELSYSGVREVYEMGGGKKGKE